MRRKKLRLPRRPKADMMPEDTSKLMREVVSDPVGVAEAARDRYMKSEDNWRIEKYRALAVVYALGRFMKYHGSAWREFSKNSFFDYRKRPLRPIKDQPQAMRHAGYLVLNAHNEAKRDRAATYVRGLEVLARRNVKVDDVVDEIVRAGGIEDLAEEAKTDPSRPQRYQKPVAQDKHYDVSDEATGDLGGSSDDDLEDDADVELLLDDRSASEARLTLRRGRDPNGRETVELEVPPKMKAWLLERKKGERVVLRIECEGADEGDDGSDEWVRLRAKHAFQWPSARSRALMH